MLRKASREERLGIGGHWRIKEGNHEKDRNRRLFVKVGGRNLL